MPTQRFDLADLLTASGTAMASSNQRLLASGAPALLQEFSLSLGFSAAIGIEDGAATLTFQHVRQPSAQMAALMRSAAAGNVTISATFIAAPSLQNGGTGGGGGA